MELYGNSTVFLFVLEILWKDNFAIGQIIYLTLRRIATAPGVYEVGNIIIAGKVRHFLVVDKTLDRFVNRSLPSADSIVSELYALGFSGFGIGQKVEQYNSFALGKIHALHLDGWEE